MKKILLILLILLPILGFAANITVPSAPGAGYTLLSGASGGYSAVVLSSIAGGLSPFATTTSQVPGQLIIYPLNATDIVTVGGNSTSSAEIQLNSNTLSIGIGTSTPWGMLSIASTTYQSLLPLFTISTSSDSFGKIFNVSATSTVHYPNANISSPNGARVTVGGFEGLDTLNVEGTIGTPGWIQVLCAYYGGASLSSDTTATCTNGQRTDFKEDGVATLLGVTSNGVTYTRLNTAGANDGAGIFIEGYLPLNATAVLHIASSTPKMEVSARTFNSGGAGLTVIGFSNLNTVGSTFETEPTEGCYFIASTTLPTWLATCGTSATAKTIQDTQVATSTDIGGSTPRTMRFRVETSASLVQFYIKTSESTGWKLVGRITENIPSTTALFAGVHIGTTDAISRTLDYYDFRLAYRSFLFDD